MRIIKGIGFAFLFGLLGCSGDVKNETATDARPDRKIDSLQLTDLEHKPVDIKQYDGKTVFINFWASWCKPCIAEMPSIEKAQHIFRDQNVVFLMASGESTEEIEMFQTAHDYKFNYVRIENSEALNIQVLPTTFIFNGEGELVFSEMGFRKWDEKNSIDLIQKAINKHD